MESFTRKSRYRRLVLTYIGGIVLVVMLIIGIGTVIHYVRDVRVLQKSVIDLQRFNDEPTAYPTGKAAEELYLRQMESQYTSFVDTVTTAITLAGILVGAFTLLLPIYNFIFFTRGRMKELDDKFEEGSKKLNEMETSFIERMSIMEYYKINDANVIPKPQPTTTGAKALMLYMEACKNFYSATNEYSPKDNDKLRHLRSAMKNLDESIELRGDSKAYQLRASCYIALTHLNDERVTEYHKKAYNDICSGLKLSPNDPFLLYSHVENFLEAYDHEVQDIFYSKTKKILAMCNGRLRDICLNDFIGKAYDMINRAINNGNPNMYYYYSRARLIQLWKQKEKSIKFLKRAKNDIIEAGKLNFAENGRKNDEKLQKKIEDTERSIQGLLDNLSSKKS